MSTHPDLCDAKRVYAVTLRDGHPRFIPAVTLSDRHLISFLPPLTEGSILLMRREREDRLSRT